MNTVKKVLLAALTISGVGTTTLLLYCVYVAAVLLNVDLLWATVPYLLAFMLFMLGLLAIVSFIEGGLEK